MELEYYYCASCGYEHAGEHQHFAYSRTTASDDLCKCPSCGEENAVEKPEEHDCE